ncbi:hypothetical protein TNIN_382901 [Trichonephila inaurata madagascariensis]|uniref:Uncharacterized protein n=1 Tax=Trichonephila inaurata madagascariensis TaxID=2747483 RepID=A0A8X6XHW3_9ARAC|nr:hypothetical protein TNIN_382901 [Trichonephila inaurata madagascariensis]
MDDISMDKASASIKENQTVGQIGRSRKLGIGIRETEKAKEKAPEDSCSTKTSTEEVHDDPQQGVTSKGLSMESNSNSEEQSDRKMLSRKAKMESMKSTKKLKSKTTEIKHSPSKRGRLSPVKSGKKIAKAKLMRGKSPVSRGQAKKTTAVTDKKLRSKKISKDAAAKKQKMKSPAKKKPVVGKGNAPKSGKVLKSKKISAK